MRRYEILLLKMHFKKKWISAMRVHERMHGTLLRILEKMHIRNS